MYKLLEAVSFAHSKGIMHRDIKPYNVLFDQAQHKLRLIDWGLADFLIPRKLYNVNVCALYYKAPELLLDYENYGFSLDMWCIGVVFA